MHKIKRRDQHHLLSSLISEKSRKSKIPRKIQNSAKEQKIQNDESRTHSPKSQSTALQRQSNQAPTFHSIAFKRSSNSTIQWGKSFTFKEDNVVTKLVQSSGRWVWQFSSIDIFKTKRTARTSSLLSISLILISTLIHSLLFIRSCPMNMVLIQPVSAVLVQTCRSNSHRVATTVHPRLFNENIRSIGNGKNDGHWTHSLTTSLHLHHH